MLIRKKSGLLRSRVEIACPVHSGRIPPDGTNRSPAAVRERWRGRSGGRKPDSQWPRHQTPLRTGSYDVQLIFSNFNDPGVIKDDNGKVIYDPRTTETKKTVYTNDDKINDSGISSSSKTSVNVKGQTVKIEAVIDKIINKSIAQTPTISYYLVDTSKSSTDDSESKVEGSKGNPYVIKATAEEIAQGKISREIPNLSNGVWMFTLSDVSNYETHTLNVTLKQK